MLNYFRRPSIHQLFSIALMLIVTAPSAMSQSGYTLWGDVKLDDSKADKPGPSSLTVVLYDQSTRIVGRQTIGSRDVIASQIYAARYDIAIEANSGEIRVCVDSNRSTTSDIRQDFG